jgi:hypothetical protein
MLDAATNRTKNNTTLEFKYPVSGPNFGLFNQERAWKNAIVKPFIMIQFGQPLVFPVREFLPDATLDSKFSIHWAITSLNDGTKAINDFLDNKSNILTYIKRKIDPNHFFTWEPFSLAFELAYSSSSSLSEENRGFIQALLKFWTALRFIEGGWTCGGADTLGAEHQKIHPWRPPNMFEVPHFIGYQVVSLLLGKVLEDMRRKVLKKLEKLVNVSREQRPTNWLVTFIASFILLHSYGLMFQHEEIHSKRRNLEVRSHNLRPRGEGFRRHD